MEVVLIPTDAIDGSAVLSKNSSSFDSINLEIVQIVYHTIGLCIYIYMVSQQMHRNFLLMLMHMFGVRNSNHSNFGIKYEIIHTESNFPLC